MAFNLIEAVRSQFSGDLVRRISEESGEDPQSMAKVLPGTIASVASGVVEQSGTEAGAGRLLSQLNEGGFTKADVPGLGEGAGGLREAAEQGHGMLGGLLGGKLGAVTEGLSRFGGLRNSSSATRLLSLAAPALMGVLGKQVRDQRMGASGLMQMLGGQRSLISAALPAGLGSLLGGGRHAGAEVIREAVPERPDVQEVRSREVTSVHREPMSRTPVVRSPQASEPHRRPSWALPLALLALVALGWWALRGRRHEPRPSQASVTQPATQRNAPQATPPPAQPEPQQTAKAPPPAPTAPQEQQGTGGAGNMGTGGSGSVGTGEQKQRIEDSSGLRRAFSDGSAAKGVILEGVEFQTGSAKLTPKGEQTVSELGAILKEKPDTRVRIEGFTDATGNADANRQLSQSRADNVRQTLVGEGIAGNRLEAVGEGDAKPVASNDTPQGRLQNRRIEVQELGQ
ncbi:OmpA family protein [Citreicoccus inhibens]|uniref:OmpA family protein n=1 Tax=Citreicoccus inhibens TaxID=2849499 RepID=UPI001F34988E|nr:OmpA family protein [Citreicoccus inhibens]